jgi:DNA-binding XRE family transcriptional regulator
MPRKTRPDPLVQDPLAESSPQRRVWASYLKAGYTRFGIAKALGVSYSTVDAWDMERSMPTLKMMQDIAELLGVPIQYLLYGHSGAPDGSVHASALGRDAVRALLNELGATPQQRHALAQHEESVEGRYQAFTREYVKAWLAAYDAARQDNATPAEASAAAIVPAITARAVAGAVAASGGKSASRDEVRAAIQRAQRKPAAAKKRPKRKR